MIRDAKLVTAIVVEDLARRVEGASLSMRCAARLLRTVPPSAETLRLLAADIRDARWRGCDGDDRETLARCAETLRDQHPITAAWLLASIDDTPAEGEGSTAFTERHLRAWALEQGRVVAEVQS